MAVVSEPEEVLLDIQILPWDFLFSMVNEDAM